MIPIRIIIADDHPVLRQGVRTFLQTSDRIEVVAEATTGEETLRLVDALHPDILLLDANLPDCDGTEIAQMLYRVKSPVKVIVLSAYEDFDYVRQFMAAQVAGYLLKEEAANFLVEAIESVARGETGWFSQRIHQQLHRLAQAQNEGKLTARELEVLYYLSQGQTNYAIAQTLKISEKTIEKHLDAIYRKLDVRSRTEAAVAAVREKLI